MGGVKERVAGLGPFIGEALAGEDCCDSCPGCCCWMCLLERKGAGLVRIWMLMGRLRWERVASGCCGTMDMEGGRPGMVSAWPGGGFGWAGGKMDRRLGPDGWRLGAWSCVPGGLCGMLSSCEAVGAIVGRSACGAM